MGALTVNLGENSYDILIDDASLYDIGGECALRGLCGRAVVITNPAIGSLYSARVLRSLVDAGNRTIVIEIPDGEEHKNFLTLNAIYDKLIDAGIDRESFIVALGGGVVGDVAGFAAATFMRGIPFVQVPTSLLAQVDSSVGGKTAIDHPRGKNLIGAFYQPRLVLADVDTLSSLPRREFIAGMAEIIKYGVIFDRAFFEYLELNCEKVLEMDHACLGHIIRRCCELKAYVVERDEKESGLRAALNFGHTFGHAIEAQAGYGKLAHGEAVAIGMSLASKVSLSLGYCDVTDVERISNALNRFGLPLEVPTYDRSQMLRLLASDKKTRNGVIKFICNCGVGNYIVENLTAEQLLVLSGLEA